MKTFFPMNQHYVLSIYNLLFMFKRSTWATYYQFGVWFQLVLKKKIYFIGKQQNMTTAASYY